MKSNNSQAIIRVSLIPRNVTVCGKSMGFLLQLFHLLFFYRTFRDNDEDIHIVLP